MALIEPYGRSIEYLRLSVTGRCDLRIGFITPISQHFCATCNRIRLAADGVLYPCLGQERRYDFRALLRAGATDLELEDAARAAIAGKPERREFRERPEKIVRFMSMTGG